MAKVKMKTNRGAAKRFRVTKSGKLSRSKAGASHILTKKTSKRKRSLRKETVASQADKKVLRKLLPYA
jgi:large subunit ribosomal protein L35